MIYCPIIVNGAAHGFVAVKRSADVPDNMGTDPAETYTYDVEVNEGTKTTHRYQVEHRYGDSVGVLLAKALERHALPSVGGMMRGWVR